MEREIDCSEEEFIRLNQMIKYEMRARQEGCRFIAGVDEAGRGPLAGPVVAAACILPTDLLIPGVDDSKKLSALERERLFLRIISDPSIIYAIGVVDSEEIDQINIYQATLLAMRKAVAGLSQLPDCLLVDGAAAPCHDIYCIKIVKGDQLSLSIAAASIIAKQTRDQLMQEYHKKWPQYGFERHKGYGTEFHKKALELHGPCPIHRQSFEPIKSFIFNSLSVQMEF